MKLRAILFFGLMGFIGVAQEISIDLPVYSPQSPTTTDLGKYGEVQVNEATGVISPSIPLFEYNAGKMTIPLSLNYSGNAVRVNQDPTWVGLNWNINPGGVITRVVKDEPDELTNDTQRFNLSETDLYNMDGVRELVPGTCNLNTDTEWYRTLLGISNAGYDTEVDIFNYNFLGYSGSFYLNTDNSVHLIKYDKELKITFQHGHDNKSIFIVQVPHGDTYLFGGANASESSRTFMNIGAGSTVNIPYAQNAFYLYKISLLNGGSIDFEYDNYDTSCQLHKIGVHEQATAGIPLGNFPCTKTSKTLYSDVENVVRLKKITNSFNSQEVVFGASSYGSCNQLTKLNTISLKSNAQQLKKIELNYLTINNEEEELDNKFFLTSVDFYGNQALEYDYELLYYNPESFPSKNSFAQDHLGYYNGKNTNTTLLPKSGHLTLDANCHFGFADREANLDFCKIGALKEIKYPTGGKTIFEYELPYKGEETVITQTLLSAAYRDNGYISPITRPLPGGNQYNIYSEGYVFPEGGDGNLVLSATTDITANISITLNGTFSHLVYAEVTAVNQINTTYYTEIFTINPSQYQNATVTQQVILNNLPPGEYAFKLSLKLHCADSNSCNSPYLPNTSISAIGFAQLLLPDGTRTVYHPGMRIAKVTTVDNGLPMVTRYYYNNLQNLNVETYQFNPDYNYSMIVPHPDTQNPIPLYILTANSVRNIFRSENGNTYEYVTISKGGDNFENGGKQLKFEKHYDHGASPYDTHPCHPHVSDIIDVSDLTNYTEMYDNDSYRNSVLIEEKFINSNRNVLKIISYEYEPEEAHRGNNIKIIPYGTTEDSRLGFAYFLYKTRSFKFRLKSTETTEFFGSDFLKEISTYTNFFYSSNKVSLPSRIESVNTKGQATKTNIYYPSDASLLNLPPQDVSLLNGLQNYHNVSAVVKTESFVANEVTETKQVFFGAFANDILPKNINASKGENNLEERITIFSYNGYGNPTLLSLKDGTQIRYFYNDNQQIILKIEGNIALPSDFTVTNSNVCHYQDLFPTCLVTKYDYNSVTNNLIRITDPKCLVYTYHYDDFNRLEYIRDREGHILSENKYNYKN